MPKTLKVAGTGKGAGATSKEADINTEERIKQAARTVFTKKGYAAARTRDIAEEAGINLALLNYYFRSKEKLFELIMMEKIEKLFGSLLPILNNTESSLESKMELLVHTYIEMLQEHPDLPMFVLSEIRKQDGKGESPVPVKQLLRNSSFFLQLKQRRPDLHPFHFFMNLLGMTIFPFVMRPVLTGTGMLNDKSFRAMMEERKELIPVWIRAILKSGKTVSR